MICVNPQRVYAIHDPLAKAIKIGISVAPEVRLEGIERQRKRAVYLLTSVPGTRALEARFHERLESHRISGEWFRAVEDVWDLVAEMKEKESAAAIRSRMAWARRDEERRKRSDERRRNGRSASAMRLFSSAG